MIILVAEDESVVAFALEWALTNAGHTVLEPAFTTAEALNVIAVQKPDLALVNLVLQGGEDGATLARELLERHDTPTLFVSEDIQGARARQDVAMGLIKKPYDASMVPAVLWFIDEMNQGRRPEKVPPQLELFKRADGANT